MGVMQTMRYSDATTQAVAFTDTLSTTGGFGFHCFNSGVMLVDSVTGTPTLSFYVKTAAESSSSYQLYTAAGTAVTMTVVAGRAYAIPAELMGANYVMAVASTGAAANVKIITKG